MARVVPALLLASALAAFLPHPAAVFAVWLGTAGALLVALRSADTRAPASYALAALVVLVVGTLVGGGLTLRGGAGGTDDALRFFVLALIATIWIPAGVYLAAGEQSTPRRLARIGLGFVGAWIAIFAVLVATKTMGDGHILVLLPGALLIAIALVWRVVRPVTPLPSDAAPTP